MVWLCVDQNFAVGQSLIKQLFYRDYSKKEHKPHNTVDVTFASKSGLSPVCLFVLWNE